LTFTDSMATKALYILPHIVIQKHGFSYPRYADANAISACLTDISAWIKALHTHTHTHLQLKLEKFSANPTLLHSASFVKLLRGQLYNTSPFS